MSGLKTHTRRKFMMQAPTATDAPKPAKEEFRIIGDSETMQNLRRKLRRVAGSKADTVLVHGESGAGKELAARAIHEWSDRSNAPFVEINCASIPESLLESELFGYERGAFTDAKERKLGLFEVAGHGTVFLDEVGEMPAKLQAKLLRVIEYRRFKRVGGTRDIEFHGRIVAATNRHLDQEINNGAFRADLYYRLNVVPIVVPPLRERKSDVPLLVEYLLDKISSSLGVDRPSVTSDAMLDMTKYSWPGNVRELRNTLQRTIIFHQPKIITPDVLEINPASRATVSGNNTATKLTPARDQQALPAGSEDFVLPLGGIDLEDLEKSMLMQALERARYNQTKAARLLHVTRHTLRYRLEKFGLLTATV
jgi:two-component system response regulator AtoC